MIARMIGPDGGHARLPPLPGPRPRVLDHCLADPRCAKVVLARNPVDSYVSLKIARKTGQWWLGDVRTARSATARFDAEEFDATSPSPGLLRPRPPRAPDVGADGVPHPLRRSGRSGGARRPRPLAGRRRGRRRAARSGARPEPRTARGQGRELHEMEAALGRADAFDLFRVPDLEPRRGPNVPAWLGSAALGLLFMPLAGGPTDRVAAWMEGRAARRRNRVSRASRCASGCGNAGPPELHGGDPPAAPRA
jgi:hypothetical protein